ncbi:MAG: NYN domain-containing protein [Chloroflexi bacterium]|nr:NYN domain-containing protein [Chloroflexota bacterium]
MTTNVYIDGFNLYNGAVRFTQYKWLNLDAMCRMLLPGHTISRIRYFTAYVKALPHDKGAPQRQGIYLRALRTLITVKIHEDGFFAERTPFLPQFPLVYPDPTKPPLLVQVLRYEEKRTDVDLATWLLLDCFDNVCDEFVVISNDSDLILPIQTVRDRFHKTIGVINPHPPRGMSGHLIQAASWHFRTINKSVLQRCQFPPMLTDAKGTFSKPPSW